MAPDLCGLPELTWLDPTEAPHSGVSQWRTSGSFLRWCCMLQHEPPRSCARTCASRGC